MSTLFGPGPPIAIPFNKRADLFSYSQDPVGLLFLASAAAERQNKTQKPANPDDVVLQDAFKLFPGISTLQGKVKIQRGSGPGHLEFYPPDEEENPNPGMATIEIRNQKLKGDALRNAVAGDLLHLAPTIPKYRKLKDEFISSLSKEQMQFARRRFDLDSRSGYAGNRNFQQWLEEVWSDALIRGYITPDEADEFRRGNAYEKQNIPVLEKMKIFLQGSP